MQDGVIAVGVAQGNTNMAKAIGRSDQAKAKPTSWAFFSRVTGSFPPPPAPFCCRLLLTPPCPFPPLLHPHHLPVSIVGSQIPSFDSSPPPQPPARKAKGYGAKRSRNVWARYGRPFASGDVVSCQLDLTAGTLR